jgi:hypothetical protein
VSLDDICMLVVSLDDIFIPSLCAWVIWGRTVLVSVIVLINVIVVTNKIAFTEKSESLYKVVRLLFYEILLSIYVKIIARIHNKRESK